MKRFKKGWENCFIHGLVCNSNRQYSKIIFFHTLGNVEWKSDTVAKLDLKEEVLALKQQPGKDILVGRPGLIVSLMELHLMDECQLCVHPVIAGNSLSLLKNGIETAK